MSKPLIAITMGDPAGVGPEICLQLLANDAVREFATPVIFGDARLLSRCARQTGLPAPKRIVSEIEWPEKFSTLDEPAVLDVFGFDAEDFTPGKVSAKTGAAGFRYVEKSIEAALAGQVAAVATAPRAFWGAYAASKAAAETLVDCYAQEVRNAGKVRVGIIDPGATRTAMRAKAYPGEDPQTVKLPSVVAERMVTLLGEQFASPHRERVNQSS